MSEYWKSTPKYWCKHCSVYVRDTKLERTNHEATGKHQGAIKRSLRDLHRTAEQTEREKERAKREVDRLNGVVSSGPSSKTSSTRPGASTTAQQAGQVTQAERQRQLEQLADLGVAIPTELKKDMAMVGDWSVTSTRVIDDGEENSEDRERVKGEDGNLDLAGRAVGIKRARELTEEEKEREEALNGLFNQNKKRKWGVGSRTMPEGEDEELDALLSGELVVKKKEEAEGEVAKKEDETEEVKKKETEDGAAPDSVPEAKGELPPKVKKESGDEGEGGLSTIPAKGGSEAPAVMFKKRKPKNARQK
ncbi:WW domain-binding protein 4 [Cladorrhinum sp. PSN332]|nr:WW domain-binding protein 4 [Cladorrhinum sp. PSN332]